MEQIVGLDLILCPENTTKQIAIWTKVIFGLDLCPETTEEKSNLLMNPRPDHLHLLITIPRGTRNLGSPWNPYPHLHQLEQNL